MRNSRQIMWLVESGTPCTYVALSLPNWIRHFELDTNTDNPKVWKKSYFKDNFPDSSHYARGLSWQCPWFTFTDEMKFAVKWFPHFTLWLFRLWRLWYCNVRLANITSVYYGTIYWPTLCQKIAWLDTAKPSILKIYVFFQIK